MGGSEMKTENRRWYLTAIASIYLVLCSVSCLYYTSLFFRPDSGTVPVGTQPLCLGMAVSAGLYFFRPSLGHHALILLTILTLITIGHSNPSASGYHLCVLFILLIPFLQSKRFGTGQSSSPINIDM